MKKIFLLLLGSAFVISCIAQKKLLPASRSALTGITLPNGSKQDSRGLSVAAAKMLLEMESKKNNVKLSAVEVFSLPPVTAGAFNVDSLINNLSGLGWVVSPVQQDKKYSWLQKENRSVIAYFDTDKKSTELYFSEASAAPISSNAVNNSNNNNQPVNTINEQTPAVISPVVKNQPAKIPPSAVSPLSNIGFAFNTTNFDDGWNATVQSDWVEVTKGNLKVLLHYPKAGTIFPADPGPMTNAAWDILVAPRYSNLRNYKTAYIATYDRPYLGMGYAKENATGRDVFIVFFHQGQTGWLEFITPDKNTFIQQYKFDPESIQWDSESDLMIPLSNMTSHNKFAIAASDFNGKWTSDYTGIQQLYNVYTGNYAGMNMNQSNEEFIFGPGNTYTWKFLAVNGMVGNMHYAQEKSAGQFTVINNWQIHFTKIETRARTYHAFWSCIKGARILNLLDADAPGSGIYEKYGLAK